MIVAGFGFADRATTASLVEALAALALLGALYAVRMAFDAGLRKDVMTVLRGGKRR